MPEVDKEREYQRKYYAQRKEALSKKKRERYANDPEVRESARKRAMARYEKTRGTGERKVRKYNLPRVVPVGGKTCLYHCVRKFADAVGRNVQTITQWENKGVIPKATMVDDKGRRWYSEAHMAAVASAVKRYDEMGERDLDLLKRLVAEE
jgi:hypothetical protein